MNTDATSDDFTAVLEFLTGPSRGNVMQLSADEIVAALEADRMLRFRHDGKVATGETDIAAFHRADGNYRIEVLNDRDLWINRRLVRSANLRDGDMIEFGDIGPMARYRRFKGTVPIRWTVSEMADDSLAYFRFSRKPLSFRLRHAAEDFGRRLIWQTTVVFRVTVIVAIVALIAFAYAQYRTNRLLEARIAASSGRLETVAASLAKAREEALKPSDLTELRTELTQRVASNVERLAALERQSGAVKRVIRDATGSIAFLQIAFSLRDKASGLMMRHALSKGGVPIISPQGQPLLTLGGEGPVATVQLTGTGFLIGDSGQMVTNRHVALPWERGGAGRAAGLDHLEPVVIRFIAYFPDRPDPIDVRLVFASDTADLALVALDPALPELRGLPLAEAVPLPGEEVVVLGYPTGLRSLLAQSGEAFVKQLQEEKDTDFWSVAQRLSRAGLIFPLASRGIVAQTSVEALVYDAETTLGGSGGPVLNAEGEVIAINTAILPEFGGSNFGVPVEKLRALLDAAKQL